MREKPILFNGEMIRAILEGRKTQTRRAVKRELDSRGLRYCNPATGWEDWHGNPIKCPYGDSGDQLWVRETWAVHKKYDSLSARLAYGDEEQIYYKTSPLHEGNFLGKWRPSIHMPRWASRINLLIKDVRTERLKDITEEDARAEGVASVEMFRDLWDSIYEKRGFGWNKNPWVWVVDFDMS